MGVDIIARDSIKNLEKSFKRYKRCNNFVTFVTEFPEESEAKQETLYVNTETGEIKFLDGDESYVESVIFTRLTSSDTTLTQNDKFLEVTENDVTITLPTASGDGFQKEYHVTNAGTGIVTVEVFDNSLISGSATITLNQWESLYVKSNGILYRIH